MCADKEETDKTSDNSAELSVHFPPYILFTSSLFFLPSSILPLLPVVVHHLDSEDNHATSESNEVGK